MISVIQIILLLAGLLVLMKGAGWFVDGVSGMAKAFHISPMVIGMTVVAMGTSLPETSVSISCVLKGNYSIAVGDVIGSNIANILLILGISAMIKTIAVDKFTIRYEIPYMILWIIVFGAISIHLKAITRMDGVIFWIGFLLYLLYLWIRSKKEGNVDKWEAVESEEHSFLFSTLMTLTGMVMVRGSSQVIVDAATVIARDMGLTDRVIGLTIMAMVTSLPELFTTTSALRKNNTDLAIGNIVGSNIFNLLFVIGSTAIVHPIQFEMAFVMDICVSLAAALLLWVVSFGRKKLDQRTGIFMLLCYVGYVMIRMDM